MIRMSMLVLLGACSTVGVHAEPLPGRDIPALLQARVADTQGKAIVVGIIDSQGRRYFSHGIADPRGRVPASESTLFRIGSVTKLFTALLLADMSARGEVRLDDPVQRFVPGGVVVPEFGGHPITLAHLSLHLSGLPREIPGTNTYDALKAGHGEDVPSLYRFLSGYQLSRAPGKAEYSNLGFSLLGFALAEKAGIPYDRLLAERIARPLGMTATGVVPGLGERARFAQGHLGPVAHAWMEVPPVSVPAGGLYSNASDLLTFLGAAFGLMPSALDDAMALMRQPYADKPDVRLAWSVMRRNGSEIWTHSGRTFGFTGTVAFDTRARRGVVLLSNSSGTELTDLAFHLLNTQFRLKQIVPPAAFVRMVEASAFGQVMAAYRALRHRDPSFDLEEGSINEWAGMLLEKRRPRDALALLKFNAEQHPRSANAFDSLGLAYEAVGDRAGALEAYRQALERAPQFAHAAERMKVLMNGQ